MLNFAVRILKGVDSGVAWIERVALAIGVLGMTLVSVANVFMRNVLGESLTFADELNQMLIILVTFLGVGYAARAGRHIRMTAIYDQLPDQVRRISMIIIAFTTAGLLFYLAWYSLDYVVHVRNSNSVTPSLQIPMYLIYTVVPVGLALGGLQYLLTAVRNLISRDVYVSFVRKDEYEDASDITPEI